MPTRLLPTRPMGSPQAADKLLIDIDGTVFVMLGLFALAWLLLGQFLWRPFIKVKSQRTERVDGYQTAAAQMTQDAQARVEKIESALEEARKLASQERADVRAESQRLEAALLTRANERAQAKLVDAKADLEKKMTIELTKLEAQAAKLGKQAAETVLGRELAQ